MTSHGRAGPARRAAHRALAWMALSALAALAAFGCSSDRGPLLRVGASPWIGFEALYLARDAGKYDPRSLRMVEFTTTREVMRALEHGSLEGVALTLDEFIRLRAHGHDFRIVLVADESSGADLLIGRAGLRSVADLRGKRVGAEASAVGRFLLGAALASAGLAISDVQYVDMIAEDAERKLASGEVDAVVTYGSFAAQLRDSAHPVLFDSRRTPGMIVDVLAMERRAIERNPRAVQSLVRGYFEGLREMRERPGSALPRVARREGTTVAGVERDLSGVRLFGLEDNRRLLGASGARPQLLATVATIESVMVTTGLISHALPAGDILDSRWVEKPGR